MNDNRFIKPALAVLFTAALLCMPIEAGNGLTDATVQSYEDQLAAYQAKQEEALRELEEIRGSQSEAWVEVGKYDELLRYNTDMKNLITKQLDTITEQLQTKKQLIVDTEASLDRQEKAFLDRMVAVYMEDKTDYIELILGSESLVDFMTKIDRINAIFEYDAKLITGLEEDRVTLEAEKAALLVSEETQKKRVDEYEAMIKQNQALYDAKIEYITGLVSDENSLINQYSYYKQLEEEKSAEIEEYLAKLAEQQKRQQTQYVGGSLWWPLDRGATYYVSSEQGWRSLFGISDFHLGIDLACANGTNVYAANSGTVLKSEYHYSYGNYVLIDHGGGISTLYAHMSGQAVSAGDYVEAGTLVGWVGLTGNTSGYHLHFEVRENGSVVNPRNYLIFP